MTDINDAIEEAKFREEALETIKRRHHHDDGSAVIIAPVEDSHGIERRIIEDENLWKLRTQQQKAADIFQSNSDVRVQKQESNDEQPVQPKKEKQIMAGCNCGKLFEIAESKNHDGMQITSFDAAGKVTDSYAVSGGSDEGYKVSGSQDKSYSASGKMNNDYGR